MPPDKRTQRIDSVNSVLEACIEAYPVSSFIISLYRQYIKRGSLSKKQLQGLYDKASKIKDLAPGKLAAVEAIIKKMPTRTKSSKPEPRALYEKDEGIGQLISEILSKAPAHKQVLFLKSKYDNNEILSATDVADLHRIGRLLLRR